MYSSSRKKESQASMRLRSSVAKSSDYTSNAGESRVGLFDEENDNFKHNYSNYTGNHIRNARRNNNTFASFWSESRHQSTNDSDDYSPSPEHSPIAKDDQIEDIDELLMGDGVENADGIVDSNHLSWEKSSKVSKGSKSSMQTLGSLKTLGTNFINKISIATPKLENVLEDQWNPDAQDDTLDEILREGSQTSSLDRAALEMKRRKTRISYKRDIGCLLCLLFFFLMSIMVLSAALFVLHKASVHDPKYKGFLSTMSTHCNKRYRGCFECCRQNLTIDHKLSADEKMATHFLTAHNAKRNDNVFKEEYYYLLNSQDGA